MQLFPYSQGAPKHACLKTHFYSDSGTPKNLLRFLKHEFLFFNVFLSSFCRRQKDAEQKSIEEEANKRIEDLVAKRVEEELERRRDEIEAEVLRRVEEAKKIMEAQMLEELERRKQEQLEEAQRREVRNLLKSSRIRLKSISSSMSCIRRPTQSTKKSTYSQK